MTYGTYGATPIANNKDFVPLFGDTVAFSVPMVASVAIPMGRFVVANGTGSYIAAVAASTLPLYLLEETIATTDSDYATANKIKSARRGTGDGGYRVEFTPSGAALTVAMIGNKFNLNVTGQFIDVTVAGTQFEVREVISATRGIARVLA